MSSSDTREFTLFVGSAHGLAGALGSLYAEVRTGPGPAQRSAVDKRRAPPAWNATFKLSAPASAVVCVAVKRKSAVPFRGDRLVGCARVALGALLARCAGGDATLELRKDEGGPCTGSVVVRLTAEGGDAAPGAGGPAEVRPESMVAHLAPSTPSANAPVALEQEQLEALVQESAPHLSSPCGIEAADNVVTAVDTTTSSDTFASVMGFLDKIVQIGDVIAEVHPYAQLAWSVLTAAQKTLKAQQDRDDKVRALWATALDCLAFMRAADPVKAIQEVAMTVQAIMKQIYECVLFLRSYGDRGFLGRTVRDTFTGDTDDAVQRFMDAFAELKQRFRDRLNLDTWKVACNVKDGMLQLVTASERAREIAEDERLESLPGAKLMNVQWDPDRCCLPGTRLLLLQEILDWAHNPDSERILWLTGPAGMGKSSVANSISASLSSFGRLGASFRFGRAVSTPDTPGHLLGNLCHQLALFDDELRGAVLAAMHRGAGGAMALRIQAKKLLVEPVRATTIVGPVVIVIDALDESGADDADSGAGRDTLVRAIVQEFPALPASVKVLITSRDEGSVSQWMPKCASCVCKNISGFPGTESDILLFIQERMGQIAESNDVLGPGWPGVEKQRALAAHADGVFIWADVACSFIENGDDPNVQLDELLDPQERVTAEAKLDRLYTDVIRTSLKRCHINNWQYVVGAIVVLQTPLTRRGMDSLLGLSFEQPVKTLMDGRKIKLTTTSTIIASLRPLLKSDPEIKGGVRLLHRSVFDFLTERADAPIRIDLPAQHGIIAMQCLTILNRHLRHDICEIGNASLLNSEVDDLPKRILKHIPEAVAYACCHFGTHLSRELSQHPDLLSQVHVFVTRHLLHWIEAMSLLDKVHDAEGCLKYLLAYTKRDSSTSGTSDSEIVGDAITLLRNCSSGIALSALHTYVSALPLTPKTSKLYQNYHDKYEDLPSIMSSYSTWTTSLRIFDGHQHLVHSMLFSKDGAKLASVSADHVGRLWDVETGKHIMTSFEVEGVTTPWRQAKFSPNGTLLASINSGSLHKIDLWDVETGALIFVLEEHQGDISFICFSPDGKKLASASSDRTVRLWDVQTGKAVGSPLQGHRDEVWSVAFSPDGEKLASGSADDTVRLWDVGSCTGFALKGHDEAGLIVFSPDGTKIASASLTNTLQLWDVQAGKAIGPPLDDHRGHITSVQFSPDGKKVATGSQDGTVRLWDVETRTAVVGCHASTVHSVAFSPDGTKLASASKDKTVCIWDAHTGAAIGYPLKGHGRDVNLVVFSPDGTRLATAAYDLGVRIWDVHTVSDIGSANVGHTDAVRMVAFSGDGTKMASASEDNTIRLWDVETATAIGSAVNCRGAMSIQRLAFSLDGTQFAAEAWGTEEAGVTICDAQANFIKQIPRGSIHGLWSDLESVEQIYHPNPTQDPSGFVRSTEGERLLWLPRHLRDANRLAVSPNGAVVVAHGRSGGVTFIRNINYNRNDNHDPPPPVSLLDLLNAPLPQFLYI